MNNEYACAWNKVLSSDDQSSSSNAKPTWIFEHLHTNVTDHRFQRLSYEPVVNSHSSCRTYSLDQTMSKVLQRALQRTLSYILIEQTYSPQPLYVRTHCSKNFPPTLPLFTIPVPVYNHTMIKRKRTIAFLSILIVFKPEISIIPLPGLLSTNLPAITTHYLQHRPNKTVIYQDTLSSRPA